MVRPGVARFVPLDKNRFFTPVAENEYCVPSA